MIKRFFIFYLAIFLVLVNRQTAFAQTTIINNPESPHELTLQVDKDQAVANGQDRIAIIATLKDRTTFEPYENTGQDASPIANAQLILEVNGTGISFNQLSQVADTNGQIKAYLTATTAGEKTITVTDPSLNPETSPIDYYKVSLGVTFLPVETPIPSATDGPTPTLTPIPTLTLIPWQPTEPIKTDPETSYFTIQPWRIGIKQSAIIKITLLDKEGNSVTDEVPYVTATGEGNHIVQPTAKVNSIAYFSASVRGERTISVRVGDVKIGEKMGEVLTGKDASLKVDWRSLGRTTMSRLDIPLTSPPKENLVINAHSSTPIYFYVPLGRHVDKVTAVMVCSEGQQEISLSLYSQNGGQIFQGYTPRSWAWGSQTKCKLNITMEPPEEPDEPPIEVPIEPIDPFGTIYDAKTGKIVVGAVVTLYELQNGNWVIWDGASLQQINPQTTDETGFYSFFVYPGKYYLTVEKEEYEPFTSEVIEVIEEIVQLDVYLEPKSNITLWLLVLFIPTVFAIGSWFIWRKKRQLPSLTLKLPNH